MSGIRAYFCCGVVASEAHVGNDGASVRPPTSSSQHARAESLHNEKKNSEDVDRHSITRKPSIVEEEPPRLPEKMEMKLEIEEKAATQGEDPEKQQDLQGSSWAHTVFAAVEAKPEERKEKRKTLLVVPKMEDKKKEEDNKSDKQSLADRRLGTADSRDSAFETYTAWSRSPNVNVPESSSSSIASNLKPVVAPILPPPGQLPTHIQLPTIPPVNVTPNSPLDLDLTASLANAFSSKPESIAEDPLAPKPAPTQPLPSRPESMALSRPESQVLSRPESQVLSRPESMVLSRPESMVLSRPESMMTLTQVETPRPESPLLEPIDHRPTTPAFTTTPSTAPSISRTLSAASSYSSRTTTTTPRGSIDCCIPLRDPRRASTLSAISSIIAAEAAACAIQRKESVKRDPRSRPVSAQARKPERRDDVITPLSRNPSVSRPSIDGSGRTLWRLSTSNDTPNTANSTLTSPTEEDRLGKFLSPLSTLILPSLYKMLDNTSILGNYALWEDAMTLKREIRAFLSTGAEEFVVFGENGEIVEVNEKALEQRVKGYVERGVSVRRRGEQLEGMEKEERLGKVKSFWQDKSRV